MKDREDKLKHTSGLEKKLSFIQSQHDKLADEKATLQALLQSQEKDITAFKAIQTAYKETFDEAKKYKDLYYDAESKRSATASRVEELTMVVNAIEDQKGRAVSGESVGALREELQRMKGHYDVG